LSYIHPKATLEETIVEVVEEDDGSGWLKIAHGGKEGLIPTSYAAELSEDDGQGSEVASPTTSRQPATQGCGIFGQLRFNRLDYMKH
jgi:hypothetical protein